MAQQQQQSNMVKPQKVGGAKQSFSSSKPVGMDDISNLTKEGQKKWAGKSVPKTPAQKAFMSPMKKKSSVKKMPTMSQVQKSVKKTMGY